MSDSYRLHLEADLLRTDLHSCQVELERVRAEAAAMRGALEKCLRWPQVSKNESIIGAQQALSNDAGADLLARYREALDLLRLSVTVQDESPELDELIKRRDILIGTLKV